MGLFRYFGNSLKIPPKAGEFSSLTGIGISFRMSPSGRVLSFDSDVSGAKGGMNPNTDASRDVVEEISF